jgi:hypothetical protein
MELVLQVGSGRADPARACRASGLNTSGRASTNFFRAGPKRAHLLKRRPSTALKHDVLASGRAGPDPARNLRTTRNRGDVDRGKKKTQWRKRNRDTKEEKAKKNTQQRERNIINSYFFYPSGNWTLPHCKTAADSLHMCSTACTTRWWARLREGWAPPHALMLRVQQLEAELPLLEEDSCQRNYLHASNKGTEEARSGGWLGGVRSRGLAERRKSEENERTSGETEGGGELKGPRAAAAPPQERRSTLTESRRQ